MTRSRLIALVPVLLFAALALLFWRGLSGDPSTLPSVLLGKPVPAFTLDPVQGLAVPGLSDADLKKSTVTVVNIWASWCVPCRDEHPLLMELAKRKDFTLVGINNKDEPVNATRFLDTLGQPFAKIGADTSGRVAIDWGGYGVPETYIVDGNGIIRYRIVGSVAPDVTSGRFDAEIKKAANPLPPTP